MIVERFASDMTKDSTSGDKKRQNKKVDGDVAKQVPAETPGKRKRKTPAKKRVRKAVAGKAGEEAESAAPAAPPSPTEVDDGWTPSDVEMLMMAIGACDSQDIHFWRNVALRVPGKTPLECNEKLIRMDLTVFQVKRRQIEEDEQEEMEEEERAREKREKRKHAKANKRREPGSDEDIANSGVNFEEEEGEGAKKKKKGRKGDKNSGKEIEKEQDVQENAFEGEQSSQDVAGQHGGEGSLNKTPDTHKKSHRKMAGFFSGSLARDGSDGSRESPRPRKKARKSDMFIDVEGIEESRVRKTSEFDAEYRKFHAGDGDDEIDAGIRRLGNKFAPDGANSYVLPGEDEADINFGPGLRKPGKVWDWRY